MPSQIECEFVADPPHHVATDRDKTVRRQVVELAQLTQASNCPPNSLEGHALRSLWRDTPCDLRYTKVRRATTSRYE